jgi:protocatechuate 3,4-dioxygenase beta subunit
VQVVGKLAGYAPARSPRLELHESKEAKVSLTLAVPASITGRVIDAVTRAGIEGANVELYSSDFTGGVWSAPRRAKTSKDGFFSVADLPAANYMCGAGAPGYADVSAWESGKSADLSKGGEQDIGEIALLKAGVITGTVVDAATGQPLRGATVEASAGTQFGNFAQESAVTGEDGRFEIRTPLPASTR